MRLHDYLRRVGASGSAGATIDTLRQLHVAHREAFLFENISIQTGGAISVAVEDIERKFLDEGRGGYCIRIRCSAARSPSSAQRGESA